MAKQVNDDYPGKAPMMSDAQLKDIATAKYNTNAVDDTLVFDFSISPDSVLSSAKENTLLKSCLTYDFLLI